MNPDVQAAAERMRSVNSMVELCDVYETGEAQSLGDLHVMWTQDKYILADAYLAAFPTTRHVSAEFIDDGHGHLLFNGKIWRPE